MLIPHLHFPGCFREAVSLYEKAFASRRDMSLSCAVHMIVAFETPQALRACHAILGKGGTGIDPFEELSYSALAGNFMKKENGIMTG